MRKVGVICLSAFLTTSVFAQVTVNVKQQTIKQALRSIEKVTDYRFFYSNQLPDLDKKVTFEVNNQSIEATMSKLLSGTGLVYEKKEDNQIYLGIKESKSGQKENKKITVTIVDDNGEPVSYTHLDVYKRQGITYVISIWEVGFLLVQDGCILVVSLAQRDWIGSV